MEAWSIEAGESMWGGERAAVMRDGLVVAAVHEERFTRRKNDDAYPLNAIESCAEHFGVSTYVVQHQIQNQLSARA